jgi:two-component system CitB family response regulator
VADTALGVQTELGDDLLHARLLARQELLEPAAGREGVRPREALERLLPLRRVETLRERLRAYAEVHARRSSDRETTQAEVDGLFAGLRRGGTDALALPKGCSPETAQLVLDALTGCDGDLSAAEVGERTGISRATAQRYLATLADAGAVERTLRYGSAGRPEHRYAAMG